MYNGKYIVDVFIKTLMHFRKILIRILWIYISKIKLVNTTLQLRVDFFFNKNLIRLSLCHGCNSKLMVSYTLKSNVISLSPSILLTSCACDFLLISSFFFFKNMNSLSYLIKPAISQWKSQNRSSRFRD